MAVAATIAVLSSCGGDNKETPDVKVTLSATPTTVTFAPKATGTKIIAVSTTGDWTATPSATWFHLDKTSGKGKGSISVTADENTGSDERTGSIRISVSGAPDVTVSVSQSADNMVPLTATPAAFDGTKRASTTYQLLVYSFADSDGDGIGDFNGISSKLDYLSDVMGVTALWLSPVHPAMSYHGYDVLDYFSLNPEYGTEDDFRNLLAKAKAKGIDIYLDYVLNHAGKDHPWFKEACADEESQYRDYFLFSKTPSADIQAGKLPMFPKNGFDAGQWFAVGGEKVGAKGRFRFDLDWKSDSAPVVTVTETDAAVEMGSSKKYIYYGNDDKCRAFVEDGDGKYHIVVDFDSDWGFLIRTSSETWDNGTKYGGKAGDVIAFGEPFTLNNTEAADIVFKEVTYYHSHLWTDWFADFNYGKASEAETSPAFVDLANSADKWIDMGVAGLRLDAVKHIYWSETSSENPTFLDKWYDRCNATYKAAGGEGDIFMVGEVFSDAPATYSYYDGLPSVFEFSFWWGLRDVLNNRRAGKFVADIIGYHDAYKARRSDAVPALKLSNHDEDRAASDLGKNLAKEKQAAAFLLTAGGKPFIYQGEELGYWGTKSKGDEYVRTPMMWTKSNTGLASKRLGSKIDKSMLTASISVESQLADEESLLNVYKTFSALRNTYPALAEGQMSVTSIDDPAIAAWYMTSGSSKLLVIHNVANSDKTIEVDDSMAHCVALLGTAYVDGTSLKLGANSSVVFEL